MGEAGMIKHVSQNNRALHVAHTLLFISLSFIFILAGCVELDLGENRDVYLGSPYVIVADCTPEDPGTYGYTWSLKKKPLDSTLPAEQSTTTPYLIFRPDKLGDYLFECRVIAGLEGFDTSTIAITCIDATWTLNQTYLDFGGDSGLTSMVITFENTGVIPIEVAYDRDSMNTADWVTDIDIGNSIVNPEASMDITVTVNKNGCGGKRGTYFILNFTKDGALNTTGSTRIYTSLIMGGNCAPTADAGPDQTVFLQGPVTLDGSGSIDGDGDSLTYNWSLTSPTGSGAVIANPTTVNPTFTADVAGDYTAQLVVDDGNGYTASDTVTISTQNSPPVANAGPDQNVLAGNQVTLNGGNSHDVDGDSFSFAWTVITTPDDIVVELTGDDIAEPQFTADAPGRYTIRLTVDDGLLSSSDNVVIIAE